LRHESITPHYSGVQIVKGEVTMHPTAQISYGYFITCSYTCMQILHASVTHDGSSQAMNSHAARSAVVGANDASATITGSMVCPAANGMPPSQPSR
jgi:hypothetical protein